MINAKKEFLSLIKTIKSPVKCVSIKIEYKDINLKVKYSLDDYNTFLEKLNFEYDNGYGDQKLFGIIWFKNRTWANRKEYDGSETWKYQKCP